MSSNTEYYQSPTRMWDSIYDEDPNAGQEDPFLTNPFPDENVTFFCYNCDMQVGAYLREDYQPVCDRCFGEFIEVQESNDPPASSSTNNSGTTVLRQASIRRSEIQSSIRTAVRNNTNSLTVPPRQDTQRDREQQRQNDLHEIQPGVSVRLHNNNRTSSNNDITTGYNNNEIDNNNDDWWDTTPPSLSIIPAPSPSPPITTDHSNGRRSRKWWQKVFSKRRSSSSSTTHATNHDGSTSAVNGRLSQFTSSLVRLKRNRNARSTTSFVSYHTENDQDFVQASSSSAIETSRPHAWQGIYI
ncbi:hypothetical protein INT45_005712 [Circinella minor]|uniref:Uncharacterized protein n=1 Tax=Circinella minor TaxID=1195481 RepID=A0A8H7S7T4_9FUNG|nr:hypothetical protein INT45_005712 [Circinella minor]